MFLRLHKLLQRSIFFVFALTFANLANAESITAQEFFDNGNAAFKQGEFAAALANYNDALANGKDTPRVFYNMGLAHYRLGQHEQANGAFSESSKDKELAALSYYHLGALAEQRGDIDEAVNWLTLARDNAKSGKLRRQSAKVLGIIGVEQPKFESVLAVGYGNDSNAFRSPDQPYIDYSGVIPSLVDPVPQSGAYIPVRIKGDYWRPLSGRNAFTTSYSFRGEYHTDSDLRNADFDDHRVTIGGERKIGNSGSVNRRVALAAFYRMHGETNFDRDDGLDRFDDGLSIADRYDFQSIGAEADLKNRVGSKRYTVTAGWEQRDYDDVPTASSYDMTNYWIEGEVKFPLSDSSRLELGYEFYARDFDERRSKDSTGDASLSNPTLEYQYHELSAGVKHQFSNQFIGEIIYFYTIRSDEFAGYNDYSKNRIRLSATFDSLNRFQTSVRLDYRDQNYPNAFAFDNPSQPQKEYQDLEAALVVDYELTDRLSIRADIKQEMVESSDPRGEYDRLRGAIGIFWQYE
jgi:hypothetical protein